MRLRLAALPGRLLHHLGLVIAFVLILVAGDFTAVHPGLAALLVFLFSCAYVPAAVVSRRAHFLYATMLLGAVAYFMACYALGVPLTWFPLLSVPLVVALEWVGQYLKKRLPVELASFPRTVFNAMNITVAVFTCWALTQLPQLVSSHDPARYAAGATFVLYAGLYLAHRLAGGRFVCTYVFATFLTWGGVLLCLVFSSVYFCWLPAVAAAAVSLFVGTHFHRGRTFRWSLHFHFSGAIALLISLGFAALWWPYLLFDLALCSLVLWGAYLWLAAAVGEVRSATLAERALAKWLFLSALALSLPVMAAAFIGPANVNVAVAALIYGMLFGWIAARRREQEVYGRNLYLLAAVLFLSAGVVGIGRQLPGPVASGWSLAVPLAFLVGLGLLYRSLDAAKDHAAQRVLAEGAIFPALFAWCIPLYRGDHVVALIAALAVLGVSLLSVRLLKERLFLYATGPAAAGAGVAAALLSAGQGVTAWVACLVAAAVAGGCFIWADAEKRTAIRGAANLGWLILSVAAVGIAAGLGGAQALYSLTAAGFIAVLIGGWRTKQGGRDVFDLLVAAAVVLAIAGAVVVGPFSGLGRAGVCLVVLSAACGAAWALTDALRYARAVAGLFALGLLLAIFAWLPSAEARLGVGAVVVAALLVSAAAGRDRFPAASASWAVFGHLAGVVLACVALIQAWGLVGSGLVLAVVPFVVLYAAMPGLRDSSGFRVGAISWLTVLALFALAALTGAAYRHMAVWLGALAVVWVALGYAARRGRSAPWSTPLYVSAGLTAAFCGVVGLFTPGSENAPEVFLVMGIVFTALFLILRKDIFVYLLTLSLSLLAYHWVKASTSPFTQDAFFYLVLATGALGVYYLVPYAKWAADRLITLPIFNLFTWWGAALGSVVVICCAVLGVSVYALKITGHPKFCLACHTQMDKYYVSWEHSSHRNVACIECHYEPGYMNALKGKLAGAVQVVKVIAHAYGSKPHSRISNRSCMHGECHPGMDVSKETVLFQGKIKFRHAQHVGNDPRNWRLNCVSCHGQVVEGQHISVVETTCLTCHFYGRGARPVAAGECQTCHVLPEEPVTFMGQAFNHKGFLKGKQDARCEHCHSQITQGSGAVSATRCESCHLRRTPEVRDPQQFHLTHVSVGHFDCLQCHDEIRHGEGMKPHQMMASAKCGTCHGGGRHSVQEQVYAGKAVADMPAEPDVMYKAGVACDGCHIEDKQVAVGNATYTTRGSGARECAGCHGDKDYGDMLADWQKETRERVAKLEPRLAALDETLQKADAAQEAADEARKLLATARGRVSCVVRDGSYGAHNYVYISTLLDRAEAEARKASALLSRAEASKGDRGRPGLPPRHRGHREDQGTAGPEPR